MPASDQERRTLRLKYQTAYEAYQSCVKALADANLNGNKPSPELLEKEAAALRPLIEARAKLLAALAHD
jgi:hypothetical protein